MKKAALSSQAIVPQTATWDGRDGSSKMKWDKVLNSLTSLAVMTPSSDFDAFRVCESRKKWSSSTSFITSCGIMSVIVLLHLVPFLVFLISSDACFLMTFQEILTNLLLNFYLVFSETSMMIFLFIYLAVYDICCIALQQRRLHLAK